MRRILVIRLGALGDFVLSFGPFAAIRRAHPDAEITLLTTAPFAGLARLSPYFDHVEVDARPRLSNLSGVLHLRRQLRGFDFVYDLQTSRRTSNYHLIAGLPRWSGIARFASHPHRDPNRNALHTIDRQRGQLRDAGIDSAPLADLSWLRVAGEACLPDELGDDRPTGDYAVLVPGASAHRDDKRWPTENYATLANALTTDGLAVLIAGTRADTPLATAIRAQAPAVIDVTGRTTLPGLAALLAGARIAIGNDTGPMHIAALIGTPCVTLFSSASDPTLCAPFGPDPARLAVLRTASLADLDPAIVRDRVAALIG